MMETKQLSAKFTLGMGTVDAPVWRRVNTAEDDRTGPYTVYQVLTRFYGQDIDALLKDYFSRDAGCLLSLPEFAGAFRFHMLSCWLEETETMLGQPLNSTVVDFIYTCRVAVDKVTTTEYPWAYAIEAEDHPESVSSRIDELKVRVRYVLNLQPKEQLCIGPLIGLYDENAKDPWLDRFHWLANEYLLPVLRKEDYDRLANDMLFDYYPEEMFEIKWRDTFQPDAEDLVKRMRLHLQEVHFTDPDLLGQLWYSYGETETLDEQGNRVKQKIRPGTILVEAGLRNDPESRNSTIMHECSHMYLDRWHFLLQMMTGQSAVVFSNRRKPQGKRTFNKNSPMDWMELQCDKLPASLLMENISTKRFVDGWIVKAGGKCGPGEMRGLIAALAARCHVSFSMAKYRLIELGYHEAEGIRCYANGQRIPDHACAGTWPEGVTYTISAADAAVLMQTEPDFNAKVTGGQYIYAEGHFCRNKPKYMWETAGGSIGLTMYARSHMDECCIAFRPTGRYGKSQYRFGVVSRNVRKPVTDKYCPKYELAAEFGTEKYSAENDTLAEDSYLWGDLFYDLSPNFGEAVNQIMKVRGITMEALAMELGVDRRALHRYLTEESPSIGHVIGICVALKVRYDISMKLLNASGNALQELEAHHLYRQFLLQAGCLTVARCEDILAAQHKKALFRGEEDGLRKGA